MPQENEKSNIVTTIAEYSTTAAELAKLKEKLAGAVYEVTTTAGMDTAKKDRRELVTLRTSLEAKRKEIKAPALERCKQIDEEAKRITGELMALEQPIDAQIKAEEERKAGIKAEEERIERERVAAIMERIDKIKALPLLMVSSSALELEEFIAKVEARQLGGEFAEMIEVAESAKRETVASLRQMLAARLEQEEAEARIKLEQEQEAARLEDLRIEQEKAAAAERERLAAEKAEQDRLRAIEQEKLAAERAELEKLREADAARQKEADEKRAAEQKIIDDERAELEKQRQDQGKGEREKAEKAAEEKRKADAEKARLEYEEKLNTATSDHLTTLKSILAACEDQTLSAPAALQLVAELAKRGIERAA